MIQLRVTGARCLDVTIHGNWQPIRPQHTDGERGRAGVQHGTEQAATQCPGEAEQAVTQRPGGAEQAATQRPGEKLR